MHLFSQKPFQTHIYRLRHCDLKGTAGKLNEGKGNNAAEDSGPVRGAKPRALLSTPKLLSGTAALIPWKFLNVLNYDLLHRRGDSASLSPRSNLQLRRRSWPMREGVPQPSRPGRTEIISPGFLWSPKFLTSLPENWPFVKGTLALPAGDIITQPCFSLRRPPTLQ